MPLRSSLVASERSAVDQFLAMDVLAQANRMIADGLDVISLAVGQPYAPAPVAALAAARTMLEHGRVGYTDALGRASLRRRIAQHYEHTYGVSPGPDRIMVTTGSSAGFNLAFLAVFDAGDRVAIAAPGYPAYRNVLNALGLVPVEIEVGAVDGYVLTAERLADAHRRGKLDGVLVASPANPTGTATPKAELGRLVAFCEEAGIVFVSDEIYHGLDHDRPSASALEFTDRAIVVNSFSKYYCMTGWRCGWLVLPPELVRAAERIGQNLYISAPDISQQAAEAAMDARAELDAGKSVYRANRDSLSEALPRFGFREIAPMDGAFYAYAAVPERFESAGTLARRLLAEADVAVTPGVDFDLRRGDGFMRLSYACSRKQMAEAIQRLGRFFEADS